jgi:Na+/melibiose symporter-like transporter
MLAFGIGQAAEGIKNQAFNVFLLFYYQQLVGVSGTLTGLALGIALVFDAVTDPLAGFVSDRFRSRWGRRHPFMFFSAFPLVLSFVALFNPPESLSEFGSFLWLLVFAVLVRASLTFYHVPHLALGAEMAHDYNQRSTVFAYSTVLSITAMAVVTFVGYRYFFPTTEAYSPGTLNPDGYYGFSLFFAGGMFLMIMLCVFGTASEIPHLRRSEVHSGYELKSFLRDFSDVFANRSFRLLFVGLLLTTFALAVEAVFSPFMGIHFWGLPTERLALLSFGTFAGLWLGLPLVPVLTRVLDKRWALVGPAIIVLINANAALVLRLADVSWFPPNESPWIFWIYFARYLVQGIFLPVIFASFNSMFADIADEIELESGKRCEGVIYAARSFSSKATAALGAMVGGILLDVIAFPRGAVAGSVPADTVWYLGFLEGPATALLSACGVLFYLRYRIDRGRHAEIRRAIDARQAAS